MTNKEIITILENYKNFEDNRTEDLLHHGYDNTKEATKRKEALDEAIKALSVPEREKGEWTKHPTFHEDFDCWVCNKCGEEISGHENITNFCPYCGADMRGGKE